MLNNNLANRGGINFAFNYSSLFAHPKSGILNVLNKFGTRDSLNAETIKALSYVYWKTEYTVDIVRERLQPGVVNNKLLNVIPHNRVITFHGRDGLFKLLNSGEICYFVDNDDEFIERINSPFALNIMKLWEHLRSENVRR